MAPPRASWKGYLKIAEVTCPVALTAAASSSERIALHLVNRKTGHRVHRQFVDAVTGKPVEHDDQVKGYEVEKDEYVVLEPEEILAAVPESDKTLTVSAFIAMSDVDDVYFDRPYYLWPSDRSAEEAFALIREGLRAADVAAVAQTVLFRRVRTVLIRADGAGLAATTLNYDYEVRAAEDAFADVPALRIKGEMLELAEHIINTKRGAFDPAAFHDRYEAALAELVKAKLEGRAIEAPKPPRPQRAADLMAALRESAGLGPKGPSGPARKKPAARRVAAASASPRRKAS
jgi:DNA end-binding protein Ku